MLLLDHFHPPLIDDPPWLSLYTLWASAVGRWLNQTLPAGEFRAFANVRLGAHVEADVAEYRRTRPTDSTRPNPVPMALSRLFPPRRLPSRVSRSH